MPVSHEAAAKLPAVSGSSGHLVVQRAPREAGKREWPGQVFADWELSYEEAMLGFVAASQESEQRQRKGSNESVQNGSATFEGAKRALNEAEMQLRDERRQVRQQRKFEDAAWKAVRAARRAERDAERLCRRERRGQREDKLARDEQWRAVRAHRRATLEQRKQEDEAWRDRRRELRQQMSQLPVVIAWMAILVVIDNCTRQCLGLPLFVAGPSVTAEMIVEALRVLLPANLRFLISDRGTHFKANAFKTLVLSQDFVHVLIARHRPQSNGIAERFILTLKEWLEDKSWHNDQELAALLRQFLDEYNNRPHQGLPIPGLSPNEFAHRAWLM